MRLDPSVHCPLSIVLALHHKIIAPDPRFHLDRHEKSPVCANIANYLHRQFAQWRDLQNSQKTAENQIDCACRQKM
jgi:hypothetical protein